MGNYRFLKNILCIYIKQRIIDTMYPYFLKELVQKFWFSFSRHTRKLPNMNWPSNFPSHWLSGQEDKQNSRTIRIMSCRPPGRKVLWLFFSFSIILRVKGMSIYKCLKSQNSTQVVFSGTVAQMMFKKSWSKLASHHFTAKKQDETHTWN